MKRRLDFFKCRAGKSGLAGFGPGRLRAGRAVAQVGRPEIKWAARGEDGREVGFHFYGSMGGGCEIFWQAAARKSTTKQVSRSKVFAGRRNQWPGLQVLDAVASRPGSSSGQ